MNLLVILAVVCFSSVVSAQQTGEQKNPPEPSQSDRKPAPERVCYQVCVDQGEHGCRRYEERCY